MMDNAAAARLANQLHIHRRPICERVSARLLAEFPELTGTLRLEENYPPQDRLSEVSVERFSELVRAMLLFNAPTLAEKELIWAQGILPRRGVMYQHQSSMVRWFFEEVRNLSLGPGEDTLTYEIERYLLGLVKTAYHVGKSSV